MGNHRRRQDKVTVAHTIIGDFKRILKEIASIEGVQSIHTGTISPNKSNQERLDFQYFTDSGLKLLAKTTTAVQEIFVVTAAPELVKDQLEKMGYLSVQAPPRRGATKKSKKNATHVKENRYTIEMGTKGNTDAARFMRSDESVGNMKERLSDDVVDRLRAMAGPPQAHNPNSAGSGKPGSNAAGVKNRAGNKSEGSGEEDFAQLLNPKDEESFEELLNKSSLDWKKFKG